MYVLINQNMVYFVSAMTTRATFLALSTTLVGEKGEAKESTSRRREI